MTPEPLEMVADTVPVSVARIRHFAVRACRDSTPGVDVDVVELLVSEVATNALVHGAGSVRVRVVPLPRGVRVEVHDGSRALPGRRSPGPLDEGGRGIALIEALSSSWGAEPDEHGKTVWFELAS